MSETDGKPIFHEIIDLLIETRLQDVHTSFPATIVAFDPKTQLARVRPSVPKVRRDVDGDRVVEPMPEIPGVPVVVDGGGGARVTWPIAVGDSALVQVTSAALDRWIAAGDNIDPVTGRRFALKDAVAIVGLRDVARALKTYPIDRATFGYDDNPEINVRRGEVRLGDDSCSAAGRAGAVKDTVDNVLGLLQDSAVCAGIVAVGNGVPGAAVALSAAIAAYLGTHPMPYAAKVKLT